MEKTHIYTHNNKKNRMRFPEKQPLRILKNKCEGNSKTNKNTTRQFNLDPNPNPAIGGIMI